MKNIKLVIFDMAGTTVNDEKEVENCFEEAAKASDLPFDAGDILAMMGWSKRLVFETLWKKALPEVSSDLIESQADHSYSLFKKILEKHYETHEVNPTYGCLDVFSWLKENNIKIALTTGFYRKVTNIILKRLGWMNGMDENYTGNGLINISVASDEVKEGRPAPDMIYRCMDLLNITDPKTVVNIGDTPSDLESGLRAGCLFSLGVTNGTHTHEQLMAYKNSALLPDLLQLKDFLQ